MFSTLDYFNFRFKTFKSKLVVYSIKENKFYPILGHYMQRLWEREIGYCGFSGKYATRNFRHVYFIESNEIHPNNTLRMSLFKVLQEEANSRDEFITISDTDMCRIDIEDRSTIDTVYSKPIYKDENSTTHGYVVIEEYNVYELTNTLQEYLEKIQKDIQNLRSVGVDVKDINFTEKHLEFEKQAKKIIDQYYKRQEQHYEEERKIVKEIYDYYRFLVYRKDEIGNDVPLKVFNNYEESRMFILQYDIENKIHCYLTHFDKREDNTKLGIVGEEIIYK